MARNVGQRECNCAVQGEGAARVSGQGSTAFPYVVAVPVDPSESNLLTVGEDGLLVDGALPGPVDATLESTSCIEVAGTGTEEDPYTMSPTLNEDPRNSISCSEDGLLASHKVVAKASLVDGGGVLTVLPAAAIGVPSEVACEYDTSLVADNVEVHLLGTVSRAYTHVKVAEGFGGVYYIEASRPGWIAGPAAEGNMLFRLTLMVDDSPISSFGVPVFTTSAEPYNIPELQVSKMTTLPEGAEVWVKASVENYGDSFAGATLADGVFGSVTTFFDLHRIGDA